MHRIDGAGNVAGMFTEGDPAVGQQATVVTAAWANDVQETLIHPLTDRGITPVKGNFAQLTAAINALASAAASAALVAFRAAVNSWSGRQTFDAGTRHNAAATDGNSVPVMAVTNARAGDFAGNVAAFAKAAGGFLGEVGILAAGAGTATTGGQGVQGQSQGSPTASPGAGILGLGAGTTHDYGGLFSTLNSGTPAVAPLRSAIRIVPTPQPTTGQIGDIYVSTAGLLRICTVAGSPGTWVTVGTQV